MLRVTLTVKRGEAYLSWTELGYDLDRLLEAVRVRAACALRSLGTVVVIEVKSE